jgi:predicted CXXCH cytochrome family protein
MARADHQHRPGRAGVLAALCVVLLAVWTGCSVEKHYKVLSFFFDGVPDPNAPPEAAQGARPRPGVGRAGPGAVPAGPMVLHKPFAENKCDLCHTREAGDMTAFNPQACLTCHQDSLRKYPRMHGPVVAGACLWCHAPHESPLAALLKAPSREICTQCHDAAVLSPVPVAHMDKARDCLECHVGHGSAKPNLLRLLAATTQAAERRLP